MNRYIRVFSLCLTIILVCSFTPVSAIESASEQLDGYFIDVHESTHGQIAVDCSVYGSGIMDRIGAENITVYYKDGNQWMFLAEKTRDNNGMSHTNATSFSNTIYFDGDSGNDYKVVVEVFAENDEGYDSRIQTFYISL